MVRFLLDHKFQVDKFGQYGFGNLYESPVKQLIHKNVTLYLRLIVCPKGSNCNFDDDIEYRSNCCVFLEYKDGPKMEITVFHQFYVLKDGCRFFCCKGRNRNRFRRDGEAWSNHTSHIPTTFKDLFDRYYLSDMDSVLHIQADLDIPADAFVRPRRPAVSTIPVPRWKFQCEFFKEAFNRINCKTDDDQFEIVSQDGRHFWVHKHIMMYRSPVFKAMFNSDAGNEGQMIEWCSKTVYIDDMSGEALKQVLRYMYLGDASQLTDQMVTEVLLFASMHFLDDLKDICEKMLLKKFKRNKNLTLDEVVEMSIESEKYELKDLRRSCISYLAKRWIEAFDKRNSFMLNHLYHDKIGRAFLERLFNDGAIQKKLNQ